MVINNFKNLKGSFLSDLKAGFIIFLIAMPLSIGIALASGAPASAGLLAAIVGGVLGSWLGGAQLTINGPAAGLIVVILGAVESLGQGDNVMGFRYMLAATIAAGILQILIGGFRLATLGLAFPSAVIHGMLSAIGAIIIAKQIPVLLGVTAAAKSIFGLYLEVPQEIKNLNPEIAFIGLSSLILLMVVPKLRFKITKKIPMPLVVVVLGIFLGQYFDLDHKHIVQFLSWKSDVGQRYLLNIPLHLSETVVLPDFGRFFTFTNLVAVFSIAVIASIESILSTFAVDKLDPQKRTSNLNRDLVSKGVCNFVLGWIGGLPIISEIVRSSANIDNGAKTKSANFFHGLFILLFLAFFPELLHKIPLACLAAILIFVGWRLAHPSQFLHAAHIGADHIASFLVTFIATLATDLLVGVALGVATEILIAVIQGVKLRDFFSLKYNEPSTENTLKLEIQSPVLFTNSLKLRALLQNQLNAGKNLILDMSESPYVDHTVLDLVERMRIVFRAKGLTVTTYFDDKHKSISKHPLSSRKKVA